MNTRVVLITGALTGIGHATALAFAKPGNGPALRPRNGDEYPHQPKPRNLRPARSP